MMRGCLQLKFSRAAAVQQWGKSYALVVPTRRLLIPFPSSRVPLLRQLRGSKGEHEGDAF